MRLYRKYRFLLLALLLLVVAVKIVVPAIVEKQIDTILRETKNLTGSVGDVSVSFFGDSWEIKALKVNTVHNIGSIELLVKKIEITGIDLYRFLKTNKLHSSHVLVENPSIKILKKQKDSIVANEGTLSLSEIFLDNLEIKNGKFLIWNKENDTLIRFSSSSFMANSLAFKPNRPFFFNSHTQLKTFTIEALNVKLNNFENLGIKKLTYRKNKCTIKELDISTAFSKVELSKIIAKERDHFNFKIENCTLDNPKLILNEHIPELGMDALFLDNFYFEVFRDKLVEDDFSKKKYYAEMLRGIPFKIGVDKINLKGGTLVYSEKIEPSITPPKLVFNNLGGSILNLSNYKDLKTETKLNAKLMGEAPISLNYKIKPLDRQDTFVISGEIKDFKATSITDFLRASMRVTADGTVDRMYFTFHGDRAGASGDIKMKYQNFELKILRKDALKINKLLSFIGNLLLDDGSDSDSEGYRYGKIKAEPDSTKSFPNYVWLCIKNGMLRTITGKGEKNK